MNLAQCTFHGADGDVTRARQQQAVFVSFRKHFLQNVLWVWTQTAAQSAWTREAAEWVLVGSHLWP